MGLLVSIKATWQQQYSERTTTILERELWEQDAKRMLHCWAINNQWVKKKLFCCKGKHCSPHLLCGIWVKIFIMNRYISKSYTTSKNTIEREYTERGQLVVSTITWADPSSYGFTGRITHLGCWENTRKACKSRAKGEWFTSLVLYASFSFIHYSLTYDPHEGYDFFRFRCFYSYSEIRCIALRVSQTSKGFWVFLSRQSFSEGGVNANLNVTCSHSLAEIREWL